MTTPIKKQNHKRGKDMNNKNAKRRCTGKQCERQSYIASQQMLDEMDRIDEVVEKNTELETEINRIDGDNSEIVEKSIEHR